MGGVEGAADPFFVGLVFRMFRIVERSQKIAVVAPDATGVFRRTSVGTGETERVFVCGVGW
jgi:hypothetical protein